MKKLFTGLLLKRSLAIVSALILFAVSLPVAVILTNANGEVNLIENGDFENGLTGYETKETAKAEIGDSKGRGGTKGVLLGATDKAYNNAWFYKEIEVNTNTEYVWSFWFCSTNSNNSLIGVLTADGNQLLPSEIRSETGDLLDDNLKYDNLRSVSDAQNWHMGLSVWDGKWHEYKVTFNSGEQTKVLLTLNMFYKTRSGITDDWNLRESAEKGTLINGNFENGLTGYETSEKAIATVEADKGCNNSNGAVLGAADGAYNNAFLYQEVEVKANTNYVWSFWFKCLSTNNKLVGVRTENGAQLLPSEINTESGSIITANKSYNNLRSAYDASNWHQGMDEWDGKWHEYKVSFNTGNQTKVLLTLNMFYNNRKGITDDWDLKEYNIENDIINGNFEIGMIGYSSDDNIASVDTYSENVFEGKKSLKIVSTLPNQKIWQTIHLSPDNNYIWKFWFNGEKGKKYSAYIYNQENSLINSNIEILVGNGFEGQDEKDKYIVGTGDWNQYSVKFNPGKSAIAALTLVANSAGTAYTDDWTFDRDVPKAKIVNGSFENNNNGYTINNNGLLSFSNTEKVDGNQSAYLDFAGGTKLSQKVNVESYTKYKWTFWIKSPEDNNGVHLLGVTKGENPGMLLPSSVELIEGQAKLENLEHRSERSAAWPSTNWHFIDSETSWSKICVEFFTENEKSVNLTYYAYGARKAYTDLWEIELADHNCITNPGFEQGVNGYTTEGLNILADSDNRYYDEYSLKIMGTGTLLKNVTVKAYTEYEWTFYYKNMTDGNGYFAVANQNGRLFPSEIKKEFGKGTVEQTLFNEEREDNTVANYHKIINNGVWSKYKISFKTSGNTNVILKYFADTNTEAYTDNWYMDGNFVYEEGKLLNSGFEDGNLSAYHTGGNITANITTENAKDGKYAASIIKSDVIGVSGISQNVKVKQNHDYIWTFWLRFDNAETPNGVQVKEYNGSFFQTHMSGDRNTVVDNGIDFHRVRYCDNEWHEYKVFISTGNRDMLQLRLLAYAAGAKFTTDSWKLECKGETQKSNTVFDIDFESKEMGSSLSDSTPWSKTDKDSHSGKYSLLYNGANSVSGSELDFYDSNGVSRIQANLETDSTYRFSFYFKGTGKYEMANIGFTVQGGSSYKNLNDVVYGCENDSWNYVEYVFNTSSVVDYRFTISGIVLGSAAFKIYVDDIKLEKIIPGITDGMIDPKNITCEEEDNLIPNGTPSLLESDDDWNEIKGVKVALSENKKIIKLKNGTKGLYELKLNPGGYYNFAFDYRACEGNSANVGLSFNNDGSSFGADSSYNTSGNSIFAIIGDTNGWNRVGYSFIAPDDGKVYLVLNSISGDIDIDNFTLYSLLPKCAKTKDLTKQEDKKDTDHASIWDSEYDADMDWNDSDYIGGLKVNDEKSDNEKIITDDDEKETVKQTGKRMLKVKKRKLISKGKPGLSNTAIVVIVVASAVAVIAAGSALIIFIKHRKKVKISNKINR